MDEDSGGGPDSSAGSDEDSESTGRQRRGQVFSSFSKRRRGTPRQSNPTSLMSSSKPETLTPKASLGGPSKATVPSVIKKKKSISANPQQQQATGESAAVTTAVPAVVAASAPPVEQPVVKRAPSKKKKESDSEQAAVVAGARKIATQLEALWREEELRMQALITILDLQRVERPKEDLAAAGVRGRPKSLVRAAPSTFASRGGSGGGLGIVSRNPK